MVTYPHSNDVCGAINSLPSSDFTSAAKKLAFLGCARPEFEIPANFRGSGGERELCLKFCAGAGGSGGKIENFARERGGAGAIPKIFRGSGGRGKKV